MRSSRGVFCISVRAGLPINSPEYGRAEEPWFEIGPLTNTLNLKFFEPTLFDRPGLLLEAGGGGLCPPAIWGDHHGKYICAAVYKRPVVPDKNSEFPKTPPIDSPGLHE